MSFFNTEEWAVLRTLSPLPAVPADPTNEFSEDAAAGDLGRKYYFDPRFSGPLVDPANAVPPGGNGAVGTVGTISCSRCHNPATGFTDRRSVPGNTSLGAGFTGRHAPTIYNVAYNTWFFWDGRKDSLWSQALGPTMSPVEHNGNRAQFAMVIRDHYKAEHEAVFGPLPATVAALDSILLFPTPPVPPDFPAQGRPGDSLDPLAGGFPAYDGLTAQEKRDVDTVFVHFGKAIAAYERRVLSTNSAFDRYVAGNEDAIPTAAKRGLKLFFGKAKCSTCHSGPNLTDGKFHSIGVSQSGPSIPAGDDGRMNGIPTVVADVFNGKGAFSADAMAGAAKLAGLGSTPDPAQQGKFKTPTLRSIGETGPYMHTGAIASLLEVVAFYNRGGDPGGFSGTNELAPLGLSFAEMQDLVAFLETLEGEELPASVTAPPVLPP